MVQLEFKEGDDVQTYLDMIRKEQFGLPDGKENSQAVLTALKKGTGQV